MQPRDLWTPVWDRRTYGLFRGGELLGVFVSGLGDECLRWQRVYGKGLTVFMLREHDITVRPDRKHLVESLKGQYQEVMSK